MSKVWCPLMGFDPGGREGAFRGGYDATFKRLGKFSSTLGFPRSTNKGEKGWLEKRSRICPSAFMEKQIFHFIKGRV